MSSATLTCDPGAEHVDSSMNLQRKRPAKRGSKRRRRQHLPILSSVRCPVRKAWTSRRSTRVLFPHAAQLAGGCGAVGRPRDAQRPGKKRGYIVLPVNPGGVGATGPERQQDVQSGVASAARRFALPTASTTRWSNKLDPDRQRHLQDGSHRRRHRQDPEEANKTTPEQRARRGKNWAQHPGEPRQNPCVPSRRPANSKSGEIEARHLRQAGAEGRQPPPLGRLGQRHRQRSRRRTSRASRRSRQPRTGNTKERKPSSSSPAELRDDLNDSVTGSDIVEMLAQHLIPKPVFEKSCSGATASPATARCPRRCRACSTFYRRTASTKGPTLQSLLRQREDAGRRDRQRRQNEDRRPALRQILPATPSRKWPNASASSTPRRVVDFIIHSVNHILRPSSAKRSAAGMCTISTVHRHGHLCRA